MKIFKNGFKIQLDKEDYHKIIGYGIYLKHSTHTQYLVLRKAGRRIYIHRLIVDCPKGLVVDHINGDGLDNRKINLRCIPQQLNIATTTTRIDNPYGFKGVTLNGKRYQARINYKKDRIYLGVYDTPEEAHQAYLNKFEELYGKEELDAVRRKL